MPAKTNKQISQTAAEFIELKLNEFAKSGETGIITVEVPVNKGRPRGMNRGAKANEEYNENRERFPV